LISIVIRFHGINSITAQGGQVSDSAMVVAEAHLHTCHCVLVVGDIDDCNWQILCAVLQGCACYQRAIDKLFQLSNPSSSLSLAFASSRPNSRQHRHLQAETENFFILYFL